MRKKFAVLFAVLVLSVVALPVAQAQDKVNVSGAWTFQVETEQGSGSPSFVFKQDGEKLTGTYKGTFGESNLTGSVKGKDIEFSFKISAQGMEGVISYKGTIESNSSMKGTVKLAELGAGTWTGKRD